LENTGFIWNQEMRNKGIIILVFLLSLVLDQLTKYIIQTNMALHQSITILENFFHITYILNKGAAFGIFSDRSESFRTPFFIAISILAILALLYFSLAFAKNNKLNQISIALILSGAVGNLIDRLILGVVRDFIDVHWYNLHWPAFNLADTSICIGTGLLILNLYRQDIKEKK